MRVLICMMFGLAAAAQGDDWAESVTLDPDACAEIWQQVQSGGKRGVAGAPFEPTAAAAEGKRWQAVQQAAGTPLMAVLLLTWLQELNPLHTMAEHPALYATALGICERAFAGQAADVAQLAEALRRGAFENGLLMYRSAEAAQELAAPDASVLAE